jgi:hypothetical protein
MLVFYSSKQYATHILSGFCITALLMQADAKPMMLVSALLMLVPFFTTRPQRRD